MMSNVSAVVQLCDPWLTRFGAWYGGVHGFVALIICLLGSVLNILNLVVLTRREMLNPTNRILSGLALADLLNELEYIPFALCMKVLARPNFPPKSYSWARFVIIHSNFSQVCHTASIFLTIILAVWRYIMVALPVRSKTLCTMQRARLAVISAYGCSIFVCIPNYFTFSIMRSTKISNGTEIHYYVHYSDLARAHNHLLEKVNFWIYGVVIKLIPCILLTIVSLCLIKSITLARERKGQLLGRNGLVAKGEEWNNFRTPRMLLAVLVLFLMTEFPQSVFGVLCIIFGDDFFRHCYFPLGDLWDIIALTNTAVNCIIYTSMSDKFWKVFSTTFGLYWNRAQSGTPPAPSIEAMDLTFTVPASVTRINSVECV